MRIGQKQKMSQQQQLSPRQMMLMKLLQMPITSLDQAIQEAVEQNPMLEIDPNVDVEHDDDVDHSDDNEHEEGSAEGASDDYEDDEDYREWAERDPNRQDREATVAASDSLTELLTEQLRGELSTDRERVIGQELIGSLDDSGYLSRSLELVSNDLAFRQGMDASPQEIEGVLHKIQALDPAGIGARNLQECLSLQMHRKVNISSAEQYASVIIDQYWEDFTNHRYERILSQMGIDSGSLEQAADIIRHLDPKPGSSEGSTQAHYILPDFFVELQGGRPMVSLNRGHLPSLQLNEEYLTILQDLEQKGTSGRTQQETLRFLKEKSSNAQDFIETLQDREKTLMQIMRAIVKAQERFFETGDKSDLRPLMQKEIAEATGYDISTVSRMVNSKYVQTDFGTLSLKECFSTAITNEAGEDVAAEKVRQALLAIVEGEDKQAPLTDDEIATELGKQGLPIARRTVAKYREQLDIPIGRLRKGLKMLMVVLLMGIGGELLAQSPMSYYDSLIYQQTHSPKSRTHTRSSKKNAGKAAGTIKQNQQPKPVKSVLDSILGEGDDMIDQIYNESLPAPLWYGNNFSGQRVRLRAFNSDSLPDEVNILLVKNEQEFCFPVKNVITSPYGWRWNRPHRGVDVRLNTGDAVHCAFDGVVRIARPMGAYGNLVVVRHYNGLETVYGHLSKIQVTPKQAVKAGDVLGLGGSTGRSTGPHLHFEVRFQYEPFDPEWILDFSNYSLRTRKLHLDKSYFGIRKPRSGEELVYKADKSYVKEEPVRVVKKERYYTTVEGDYSELIALRYGITREKLLELNPGLKKVKPGMRLRVR